MRDHLKKSELWSAAMLLVLHVLFFPTVIAIVGRTYPGLMSDEAYNFVYYCLSTVLCFVLLGTYLRRSFDHFVDHFGDCLRYFAFGILLWYGLTMLVSVLLARLGVTDAAPNDRTAAELLRSGSGMMLAAMVFLAPIVEECLFRGGVFCGLYRKSRVLAYAASVLLFAVYHIWQFIFATGDWSYLIYILSYLPAGFVLCWVYDKSGSVWTSIVLHICNNLYAAYVMMKL